MPCLGVEEVARILCAPEEGSAGLIKRGNHVSRTTDGTAGQVKKIGGQKAERQKEARRCAARVRGREKKRREDARAEAFRDLMRRNSDGDDSRSRKGERERRSKGGEYGEGDGSGESVGGEW